MNNRTATIKRSFLVGGKFSPQEFNQSDFGRIYFNLPRETVSPVSTEQLAQTLKKYNKLGKKVTIRNTGHSVNGQTLTSGIEISVAKIKTLRFDEHKLQVTVGCGNTWDEVLKAVRFPKFCLPVFPNNPNQQIKIGGTAAVGGVGPYSSKKGGFWNHVISLKLVTMTGEIISCSRRENYNLMKFALGGFGRIGVISELTLAVEKSQKSLLALLLLYHNDEYYKYLKMAMKDKIFDGAVAQEQMTYSNITSKVGLTFKSMLILKELDKPEVSKELIKYIKDKYRDDFTVYWMEKLKKEHDLDISWKVKQISKEDLVYSYPKNLKYNQLDLCHPWSDYILSPSRHVEFMKAAEKIIEKYDMVKYVMKTSILHGRLDLDLLVSYGIKRMSGTGDFFPLSLDLENESYVLGTGVMPTVPSQEVGKSLKMVKELTDLVYDLDGKRYLYGIHSLSRPQVEKQFGRKAIQAWQKIKDKLDPKHLLNIGVIEQLD